MSVVGFDLGNESCIVAVARQRGIDVVLNDESNRETPAVVSFSDKQRFLGSAASASASMNPTNTVSQIKRLLARPFSDPDLQRDLRSLPFSVTEGPFSLPLVTVDYLNSPRTFTPTQLLSMVLTDLKRIAEKNLTVPVSDCCIGIPVYFTDLQRRAVLDAARIASLNPLCLLHETTSTALGYGIYKPDLHNVNIVFVDIGHASMQVCVARFRRGELVVLAHAYDRSLGGRDFDEALFDHFAVKFKGAYGIDVRGNPRASLRLRAACEKLKKVLSANPEAPLNIECLMEEKDVRGFIKREEFERISGEILERVKVPLEKALEEARLTVKDIYLVEVVGSGSRVPAIIRILKEFFGKEPRRTLNASECVARGCALQCAILSPTFAVRELQVRECFPFTIVLSCKDSAENSLDGTPDNQQSSVVFLRGDTLPSTQVLTFHRSSTFLIDVMESGTSNLHVLQNISTYTIGPFQATKAEGAMCKVKVCLDLHGIVFIESATMCEEELQVSSEMKQIKERTQLETDESLNDSASHGGVETQDANSFGSENSLHSEDKPQIEAVQEYGKIEAQKNKVKETNVQVAELVYGGMTSEDLRKAVDIELEMVRQDRIMEETKDTKNAVEASVYDLRNKLHNKYHDFVSPEEKELFSSKLQEVEDWLYEDGEDQTKEVYDAKLQELKKYGDLVEERYKEFTNRKSAIEQYLDRVEVINRAATRDPRFAHIDISEKEKVVAACEDANACLFAKIDQQDHLPKHATSVLTVADIERHYDTLDRYCRSILFKPKSRLAKQQTPPQEERQPPLPDDTAPQPQVGDGSGDHKANASDHDSESDDDHMETEEPKVEDAADTRARYFRTNFTIHDVGPSIPATSLSPYGHTTAGAPTTSASSTALGPGQHPVRCWIDAAYSPHRCTYAAVLLDSQNIFLEACSGPTKPFSAVYAEAMALRFTLQALTRRCYTSVSIMTDSLSLVNYLHADQDQWPWYISLTLSECLDL